jgi:pimeloyl-ACP methyl ester carboxylesterase
MTISRAKESFSNLTLEGSELKAAEPLFGSREEKPTFIRELWQLRWRPNDPIDLYIILPRNVKKPPVALYLYSFPTDTDRFKDDRYCERVTQNGVAAIGFVSALTGQRYAFRPFKQWFVSELPESLASSVHDVQMILNQLKTREDLDLSRIGMFGQGSGGAIAILAAAVDPRIQAVDLLDPWGDWPDWFAKADAFPEEERAAYLKPEFQKSLEPLEPLKYLPSLKDRKVRMLFMKENGEPEEAVKKLVSTSPSNAEIQQYATGRQMFQALSGGRVFSWMAMQLHAQAAPPMPAESARVKGENTPVPAQK